MLEQNKSWADAAEYIMQNFHAPDSMSHPGIPSVIPAGLQLESLVLSSPMQNWATEKINQPKASGTITLRAPAPLTVSQSGAVRSPGTMARGPTSLLVLHQMARRGVT